jgi:DNA-binding protein HU-beta
MATKAAAAATSRPMTQAQIISALADQCDVNKTVVKALLEAMESLAVKETKRSGKFVVPGFGRIVKSDRKARLGRNPATGETIKIPAKKVVKFRMAKSISEQIVPPKKK